MQIVAARIYRQYQPFTDGPYRCRGHSEHGFDSTLVELHTDTGLTGWGETAPLGSFYSEAFAEGLRAGLGELLPQLLGADPRDLTSINTRMDDLLNGHPYVKTPIDMACWDLLGQSSGLSIATLTGGHPDESALLYRSVSQAEPERMAEQARLYVDQGYQRIQVKVGDDPIKDAERMRAVRAATGPEPMLLADANGAWSVDAALRFVRLMAQTDYYLEQPCATLRENADVRRHAPQPMILDESIESAQDLLAAYEARVPNGITIKLSRVGGISKARQIRDMAVVMGLRVCIEDTGGSDIDTAATTHLMLSTPTAQRFHTVDFMNWVTVSNGEGMPVTQAGYIRPPSGPGLGLNVDAAVFGSPLAEFG